MKDGPQHTLKISHVLLSTAMHGFAVSSPTGAAMVVCQLLEDDFDALHIHSIKRARTKYARVQLNYAHSERCYQL
jgi:hypothetical protein